jgi:AGCS family alanine or glycine:cation symporter
MWLLAIIGAASSMIENTLAQLYKVQEGKNTFRGGPAYYMEKGLGKRWMGVIFAILITCCFGLVFNSVQSNTIAVSFHDAFNISPTVMGAVLSVLTAVIIFGGVHRIAKVVEIVVPFMAIIYLLLAAAIIIINLTEVPAMIKLIFSSAFGVEPAAGGVGGYLIARVISQGVKRGLFSNEAAMGSSPNAGATADVEHPVKQGMVQTLGVFVDTLLICSATAFIIILSKEYVGASNVSGIALTQNSIAVMVGEWARTFLAVCIFLFAFSSIVGNYYYGESNIEFIKDNKVLLQAYRVLVVLMVFLGSQLKVAVIWNMADLFMGLMAVLNLIAIVLLSKEACYVTMN